MKRVLNLLLLKLIAVPLRILDILRYAPNRTKRILQHFQRGIQHLRQSADSGMTSELLGGHILTWWIELPLLVLDLLGGAEAYETLLDFLKPNSRPLTQREEALARTVFQNSINYSRVRIDTSAMLGPRQFRLCYVSFYIINNWGPLSDELLIHELVHVWQYQHGGIRYIPRALMAQQSPEGYNYGGSEALATASQRGQQLQDFNFEQQADIVTDYFRLSQGQPPRWGHATPNDLPLYRSFVEQLVK